MPRPWPLFLIRSLLVGCFYYFFLEVHTLLVFPPTPSPSPFLPYFTVRWFSHFFPSFFSPLYKKNCRFLTFCLFLFAAFDLFFLCLSQKWWSPHVHSVVPNFKPPLLSCNNLFLLLGLASPPPLPSRCHISRQFTSAHSMATSLSDILLLWKKECPLFCLVVPFSCWDLCFRFTPFALFSVLLFFVFSAWDPPLPFSFYF